MKDYYKNKESSYLNHWDVNSLYGWPMLRKLLLNNFKWIEETSQFNDNFIKNYNEESDEGYFLEVDVQYPEKNMNFIMTYNFSPKERNLKKSKCLLLIYMIKMNMLFTQEI